MCPGSVSSNGRQDGYAGKRQNQFPLVYVRVVLPIEPKHIIGLRVIPMMAVRFLITAGYAWPRLNLAAPGIRCRMPRSSRLGELCFRCASPWSGDHSGVRQGEPCPNLCRHPCIIAMFDSPTTLYYLQLTDFVIGEDVPSPPFARKYPSGAHCFEPFSSDGNPASPANYCPTASRNRSSTVRGTHRFPAPVPNRMYGFSAP